MLRTFGIIFSSWFLLQAADTPALEAFTRCDLGKDFQIVQNDRLEQSTTRTVETLSGTREVDVLDGYRILITYKNDEPFVNLKAEQLNVATYGKDRQNLIDSLEFAATKTAGMESRTPIHTKIGRFESFMITRKNLEGGVLSIVTMFDDAKMQVLTAYVLNDEPQNRKFKSIEEFKGIRDDFLTRLSGCGVSQRNEKGAHR
jgi:hypothetical protein